MANEACHYISALIHKPKLLVLQMNLSWGLWIPVPPMDGLEARICMSFLQKAAIFLHTCAGCGGEKLCNKIAIIKKRRGNLWCQGRLRATQNLWRYLWKLVKVISQSFLLLKAQLLKGFGINGGHTAGTQGKRRLILLLIIYILLELCCVLYGGSCLYAVCRGASRLFPGLWWLFPVLPYCVYLVQSRSGLPLPQSYDMLAALPVRCPSIIVSRLLHMWQRARLCCPC